MAALTCPNCQTVIGEGTTTCPGCGNALGASQATTYSTSAPPPQAGAHAASAPPPPAAGAHARPQAKFDLASVGHVDRLVGGATFVLFISLFLPWFSVKAGPFGGSASALSAHGYMYITLILSLAIIALIAAEILGLWKIPASTPMAREQVLLIATLINLVLVLIAFLFKPSGLGVVHVGWSWGAFVGLVAAVVAAFPLAWPAIQARRGK
jgi:hypothetical protein